MWLGAGALALAAVILFLLGPRAGERLVGAQDDELPGVIEPLGATGRRAGRLLEPGAC